MSATIKLLIGSAVLLVAGVVVSFFVTNHPSPSAPTSGAPLHMVVAENFWGSLATQIGGSKVVVDSIVTDPNADPHDYEATTDDARAVADADYVVENGAGYDTWMDKLLGSASKPDRIVLNIADLVGKKSGDNPHLWYDPEYVNAAVVQMEHDLAALDPADAAYFKSNSTALMTSLSGYQNTLASIKAAYAGIPVGSTEDIAVYFAAAAGVNLNTPPAFIQAVGEGNDPSAASVAQFQDQINRKEIKVLIYNVQTDTPITESMKSLAEKNNIPIVPISETLTPASARFQDWMGTEADALQAALQSASK